MNEPTIELRPKGLESGMVVSPEFIDGAIPPAGTALSNGVTPVSPEANESIGDVIRLLRTRIKELEGKFDRLAEEMNPVVQMQARRAMMDMPTVFEFTTRGVTKRLQFVYPSTKKLERIGDLLVEVVQTFWGEEMQQKFQEDFRAGILFLWTRYKKTFRPKLYLAIQILLDPDPNPDLENLAVSEDDVACLNLAEFIETVQEKCRPFVGTVLGLLGWGVREADRA